MCTNVASKGVANAERNGIRTIRLIILNAKLAGRDSYIGVSLSMRLK